MSDFSGKVVLITGAASGFGKILAERLASLGARLVLSDLNLSGVETVAKSLDADVVFCACDVSKELEVQAMCQLASDTFGRLDIAINNAGMSSPMKGLLDTTEQDMDVNFNVNAKGVFFGMKHQIPLMLDAGQGTILNVASMAGLNGAPKLIAYAAAKHAVVGITKTAAVEFARKNIRINAVCPFFSPTPLVSKGLNPEFVAIAEQGSPMKRLGTPDEMVSAMLHIIAPDNTYMTGQAIAVDGGVSAF